MIGDNVKFIPARPGESKITLADNSKIIRTFDWQVTKKIENYIKDQLNA